MRHDFFAKTAIGGLVAFAPVNARQLSLEEATDGVARKEPELCFAARLTNPELLSQALTVEDQEQYEIELPAAPFKQVRARVRRSHWQHRNAEAGASPKEEATTEVLTWKHLKEGERFPTETNSPAPEGLFDVFKVMTARKGMKKVRHTFPSGLPTGEVWEVDVFRNEDGTFNSWVKIDFEFKEGSDYNQPLPPFPEGLVDIIDMKLAKGEQRDHLTHLFKTVFTACY